jgi:hypothetical protein
MQTSNQIKIDAEALRLAAIAGLVSTREVIRWADELIGRIDDLPSAVFDVSLARDGDLNEVVSALSCMPGAARPEDVSVRLFVLMLSTLEASSSSLPYVTRALEHMAVENMAPSPDAQSRMYGFADHLDLALRGPLVAQWKASSKRSLHFSGVARCGPRYFDTMRGQVRGVAFSLAVCLLAASVPSCKPADDGESFVPGLGEIMTLT